jgi:hypothetical protein
MFGPYVEREIPGVPIGFVLLPPEGSRREFGLLTNEPPALAVMKLTPGDSLAVVRQVRLDGPARAAAFLGGNPSRSASYALLGTDGDSVRVLKVGRKTVEDQILPLPGRADGILCADIDSDGHRDVVAFGRTIAGLSVLKPGPKSAQGPQEPLFPEFSAADVAVLDVDGDGVNDVFLLDWLGDRLRFYEGIGGGVFSESSVLELPGEPGAMSVLSQGADLIVAVTIPSARQIAVLSRGTTDRLSVQALCSTPWAPEQVEVRDVNGDGRADVLCSGAGEVAVYVSAGRGTFRSPLRFRAGGGSALWALEDVDGDRVPDLLLADAERRTVGAATRANRSRTKGLTSYLVGTRVEDVLIAETDGDRRNDIVVTCQGALTMYSQLPGGLFEPRTSVEIPAGAKRTLVVSGGARPRFVVAFPGTAELGAVAPRGDPALTMFPAGSDPWVLATGIDPSTGMAWILSRYRPGGNTPYSLAAYEQLNERQYLERRIGGSFTGRVLMATARPAVGGSAPMLVVGARDLRENAVSVFSYALGANGQPFGEQLLSTLEDSVGEWIGAEDLDGDGRLDMILGLQRPTRRIALLYGEERPVTPADFVIVEGLGGADERGFDARDVDGDGVRDLLAWGEGRKSIAVAYGTGSRSFAAPRVAVRTGEILAFAAGPLTGECDLVVAESRGTMTVFHAPFGREK